MDTPDTSSSQSGTVPVFQDITLFDQDSGEPFIFTAKEQEFFWRQGFTNVPRHSPEKRRELREKRAKGKPLFNVSCKVCGRVGKILSEPPLPREVYCEQCFQEAWEAHLTAHPEERALHPVAEPEPEPVAE